MSAITCLLCGYEGDAHEVYTKDCTDRIVARARRLEEEMKQDRLALRAAYRIISESAPSSFAGAWLPDFERVHGATVHRAIDATEPSPALR